MNKQIPNKLTILFVVVVGMLLIVTGLFYSSFALVEPVKSISFTSEKLNYNEKTPGSFKVDKSAEWIDKGKARITFDVDTILKTEGKNTDILFVLDISGSMMGEKLDRVKKDSIELINSLLSDSNNSAALITFDTNSKILSDFTNDKEILINLINNLNSFDNTNYYRALVNVNTILKNYVQKEGRNCIVLFLTDGYPNADVPNEESYFEYLKQEYPYITVNGIQYEMGKDILEPIKKVSDNQYIADMKTLNNVLFDASVTLVPYDKFILTDYIDTDNFYLENVNDIKISQGKVDFNEKEQKITWTIDPFDAGKKAHMTIDVTQKEEIKLEELVSTNKKETIVSKIGEIEENITSNKTPILKQTYQVIYEGNAPDGCTLSNVPEAKSYSIFDIVKIDGNIPMCEGYQFKGWKIMTPSVKKINDDYFEMSEKDVVLRAEWADLSFSKTMSGEIYIKIPPVLQKIEHDGYYDGLWAKKESITKIIFQNEIRDVQDATETFDVSEAKNGGVMAYLVPNTDNTSTYTAYIQGDEKIFANEDSSNLFEGFTNLTTIEGMEYFDTSKVTNMSSMFGSCENLVSIDFSYFDTSNVTDMNNMFFYCRSITNLDVSHFDTSNVIDMSCMFSSCIEIKELDLKNFITSNVTNMGGMFEGCYELVTIDTSVNFDTSNVRNMYNMFGMRIFGYGEYDSTYTCLHLKNLDVSNFDTSKVREMGYMFYDCRSLTSLDLSNFDTSRVTSMEYMFYSCEGLTNLNLSGFNTMHLRDMENMFYGCSSLTSLDLSSFDTSNVFNMGKMFYRCSNLTSLNLSNFDTSNVTLMDFMFCECRNLPSLDISHFNTSKVKTMRDMFSCCEKLESLDLNNFNTSKVVDMRYMFNKCFALKSLDLSNFDTSNVNNMENMFYNCSILPSLDLNNFDTSNVTNMNFMFASCNNLVTTIDISNPSVSKYSYMFSTAATNDTAKITVNYIDATSDLVDKMVATKSDNSNVIKGKNILLNVTILGNSDIEVLGLKIHHQTMTLSSISKNSTVISFKMNGVLVNGNQFIMPETDVTITDIEVIEAAIIESEHNPYLNSLSDKIYGEKTFEGANSLIVILDYQTEASYCDYISLYDKDGNLYGEYGGSTRTTETFSIPGDYIKITFTTDSSDNNYYGFQATVIPNYNPPPIISIVGNNNVTSDLNQAFYGFKVTLSSTLENYGISSFKMNGTLILGNSFEMPNEDVTITDVELCPYRNITVIGNSDINLPKSAYKNQKITLSTYDEETDYSINVISFKVNGVYVNGDSFVMPDEDVIITEVEAYGGYG